VSPALGSSFTSVCVIVRRAGLPIVASFMGAHFVVGCLLSVKEMRLQCDLQSDEERALLLVALPEQRTQLNKRTPCRWKERQRPWHFRIPSWTSQGHAFFLPSDA
jgi:hypothetical protein